MCVTTLCQDGYLLLSYVDSVKQSPGGLILRFAKAKLRDAAHASGGLLQLEVFENGSPPAGAAVPFAAFVAAIADAVKRVTPM